VNDFQKFGGSGLDRIPFLPIRIGLGLKNFTVRSSLDPQPVLISVLHMTALLPTSSGIICSIPKCKQYKHIGVEAK